MSSLDQEVSDKATLVEQPLVSVLMPAYNHAPYIARAIASVLAQETTFAIELLVGDDASADTTREIALKYQREAPDRVRIIFSERNVGMHANHGRLISAARGDFIAYCEGDDYWIDRSKLQKQVEWMRENPTCGLVHGNYLNLVRSRGAWRTRLALRKQRDLKNRAGRNYIAMLQANRIQTCTVLARRELIRQYRATGPGVGSYKIGDWPEFLFISHESSIGFINEPLSAYRRTPGSVTNSGRAAEVRRGLDAIGMVEDFCEYFKDADSTRRTALIAQYKTLMFFSFRAGDRVNFEQAEGWLSVHYPAALASPGSLIMRALINWPRANAASVWLLEHASSIRQRVMFKKVRDADDA